jgi:hypothetical protein
MDYFLPEEDDVEGVDGLFEKPLTTEQEEVFNAEDESPEQAELAVRLPFIFAAYSNGRTSTLSVYDPTMLSMCSRM